MRTARLSFYRGAGRGWLDEYKDLAVLVAACLVVFGVLVFKYFNAQSIEMTASEPALQHWNAAPADDPDFNWRMQYKLPAVKFYRKYRYRLSMEMPSGFNAKKYEKDHPDQAVYYTDQRPENGPQWLLIFSQEPPQDRHLAYRMPR